MTKMHQKKKKNFKKKKKRDLKNVVIITHWKYINYGTFYYWFHRYKDLY